MSALSTTKTWSNAVNGFDSDGAFWQELKNWLFGPDWISNQGRDFISSHPGAEISGWEGDRLTGYASVGYTDKGVPTITRFKAVQDYTFNGVDVYFDFNFELTLGFRASALVKGLEGFDVNMGSVTLASYRWLENKWDLIHRDNYNWSAGFDIAHEGISGGFEASIKTSSNKEIQEVKLGGAVGLTAVELNGYYDLAQKKLGAELGMGTKGGIFNVTILTGKIVFKQHSAFRY
ncbi:hypothetical protein LLH06_10145 [Mucilaginibacter daejeonensis]|uniref:hypothetical protein n=1 Tax=Mucilaginibacter daejeonensis TaxID=398049 RepID=UPI001D170A82|nr:hypothetical protein [Mucilaginibacter daejeonensis]UEG55320.1 hypothetical protein LLH06_10145 [Mucilaginibacter daejeonensis]